MVNCSLGMESIGIKVTVLFCSLQHEFEKDTSCESPGYIYKDVQNVESEGKTSAYHI